MGKESTLTKVLFLIPSLGTGGAEAQVVDVVNGINPDRFKLFLVSFEKELDRLSSLDRKGVEYHHIQRRSKYDWTLIWRISDLIREKEIEVVHCTLQIAMLVGMIGAFLSGKRPKIVGAIHTTIARNKKDEMFDRVLYRHVLSLADAIIFVCDAQRAYWQKTYNLSHNNTVVIHNGIDTMKFRPMGQGFNSNFKHQKNIPESTRLACCIAAFRQEKGHRILLEAIKIVAQRVPDSHFVLVGDGPERAVIEYTVKSDIALQKCVHFLGVLSDVRPVIEMSEFLIIPSTSETFSIAMLEAMSMERPVVATNIGGAREAVIEGKTGLLVQPGSAEALAIAIQKLFDSQENTKSMGLMGRQMVLKHFDKKQMIEKTEQTLLNVVSHHC